VRDIAEKSKINIWRRLQGHHYLSKLTGTYHGENAYLIPNWMKNISSKATETVKNDLIYT